MKTDKNQLPLLVGAVILLLSFVACEYERGRPSRELTESFQKTNRELKEFDCKLLKERKSWTEEEYDAKCGN